MGTAVFIDDQNVSLRHYGVEFVQNKIRESRLVDKIVLQRAYAFQQPGSAWREELAEHGIELVELDKVVQNGKTKPNQVDMKISIDIPAMVLRRPSIKTVVLVSGDGDFRYLMETLREYGKQVLLVSKQEATSDLLLPLCDDWVDLSGGPLSRKLLRKLWLDRLPGDRYRKGDPFVALRTLVEDSLAEPLMGRLLREGRVDVGILHAVFQELGEMPQLPALGLRNWTRMVEQALTGTQFALAQTGDQLVLTLTEEPEDAPPYQPVQLYRQLCGIDARYSPARARAWLKKLSRHSPTQLAELLYYVELFQANGLIGQDATGHPTLPEEEAYPAQLVRQLKQRLKAMQCGADPHSLRDLETQL